MISSQELDRASAVTACVGGGGTPLLAAWWISLLLLAGLIWLRLITWEQYGLSWDEPFRWEDGRQELLYFQELFAGARSVGEGVRGDDAYPPLFDLAVAASVAWTEMNPLQAGHAADDSQLDVLKQEANEKTAPWTAPAGGAGAGGAQRQCRRDERSASLPAPLAAPRASAPAQRLAAVRLTKGGPASYAPEPARG